MTFTVSDGYRISKPARITFSIQATEPTSVVVTTTTDVVNDLDGLTSLREAIAYANTLSTHGIITFDRGVSGTIVLTNGTLILTRNVTIAGPKDRAIVLDGNQQDRVLYIQSGTTTLSNLTITRGNASGIYNEGATLVMSNCILSNNTGGSGGGLCNYNGSATHHNRHHRLRPERVRRDRLR